MEHAAPSSLISFGLTADTSSERSSFRSGLLFSCLLHALIIVIAMFVRFQSESEQPLRAIDVALISLPAQTPAPPSPKPAVTPTTKPSPKPTPAPMKKAVKAQPTPKKVVPPAPKPITPPTVAPPVEDILPPLPTETASEQLSESLSGAIKSIVVPQKRETPASSAPPSQPDSPPTDEQTPLIDKLQLPSAPPTIARPQRLQRGESVPIPSVPETTSPKVKQEPAAPPKPEPKQSAVPVSKVEQTVKPAPAPPSLREVTPFQKPKQPPTPANNSPAPKIKDSLKRSLPDIPLATPANKIPKVSRKRPSPQQKPASPIPQVSAPQMAKIPDPKSSKPIEPAVPKMSETVKKLMEGLKTPRRTLTPRETPTKSSTPTIPATKPPPSAIDQRIAKLSIPEVAPVESIKQRLQLLDRQATGSAGGAASKPSPGKNRYLAMVEDTIDRQWVAPPLVASTPVVVLKFRISRSGDISRIHITESSGHAHYDSAAQRAVQAVNPLPPFPSEITDSFFDVQYRFIKD